MSSSHSGRQMPRAVSGISLTLLKLHLSELSHQGSSATGAGKLYLKPFSKRNWKGPNYNASAYRLPNLENKNEIQHPNKKGCLSERNGRKIANLAVLFIEPFRKSPHL